MKFISKILLASACLSSMGAFAAAGNDAYKEGTYATYTRVCGIHLEKDGDNLLLTYTPNPMYNDGCEDAGETQVLTCTADGACSYSLKYSDAEGPSDPAKATISFRVLQNGDVLRKWEKFNNKGKLLSSTLAKFTWWRTW